MDKWGGFHPVYSKGFYEKAKRDPDGAKSFAKRALQSGQHEIFQGIAKYLCAYDLFEYGAEQGDLYSIGVLLGQNGYDPETAIATASNLKDSRKQKQYDDEDDDIETLELARRRTRYHELHILACETVMRQNRNYDSQYSQNTKEPMDKLDLALQHGALALLDATWVVKHAFSGGVMPHRSALPKEAFLPAVMDRNRIVALSYMWQTPTHPDPQGWLLNVLAQTLVKQELHGTYQRRVAIFWDYASLYQHKSPGGEERRRSQEEERLFQEGLNSLSTLYSCPRTEVWRFPQFPPDYPEGQVPTYNERGWPVTEWAWASLSKPSRLLKTVLTRNAIPTGTDIDCGRDAPQTPQEFETRLESCIFTNEKEDRSQVLRLYRDSFHSFFGQTISLDFSKMDWGNGQLQRIASILSHGHAPQLEILKLNNNSPRMSDPEPLVHILRSGKCPRLRKLELYGNPFLVITQDLVECIVCLLESVDLSGCTIPSDSIEALAKRIAEQNPSFRLRYLDLGSSKSMLQQSLGVLGIDDLVAIKN